MKLNLASAACVLFLSAASSAAAFTFQPMFVRLDPTGPGSIQTFEISNESDEALAVKLSILTRVIGSDGTERNREAGRLFTVYPPRLVVEPHSSAAVKLQWNGSSKIDSERAYRLVAENIALDTGPTRSSGIKVMYRYVASVYIGDPAFTPNLVSRVRGAKSKSGETGFDVEIVNRGKSHVVADSARLNIAGVGSGEVSLDSHELGPLSGANYLPGSPRRLFIPRSDAVPGKTYNAQLAYEAQY